MNDYNHDLQDHNKNSAYEMLPYLFKEIDPKSIVDIGCGTGTWLSVAKELGVTKVLGVDGILAQKNLLEIGEKEFLKHDLTQPLKLGEKFNMAFCLEVAEHLPASAADTIVETLTSHSDIILFSAAIPGQDGQFHINEQWPEYWQEKFKSKGYAAFDILRDKFWDNPKIECWYKQNIILYAKTNGVTFFNYTPTEKVVSKVHPDLYNEKINKIGLLWDIIVDRIWKPKFGPTFRLLLKSLFNVSK